MHIEGKTGIYQAELRLKAKDGRWVWIGNYGKVIERTTDGKAICFSGGIYCKTR